MGLLKELRRGWRPGKFIWLWIVSIYLFPFSESYAISSELSGKKSAVHMALSPLPVHRFRPLYSIHCLQSFPPPRCQPCHHVVFPLQRFDLVDMHLVERKGREGSEQMRPDVDCFLASRMFVVVFSCRWCGTVTR